MLAKIRRPSRDAVGEHAEVLVEQHDVGGVLGHVGGGVHRDADVGGVQRDGVVDAVAQEGDVHARPPRDLDQTRLLIGTHPREDRGAGNGRGERVVVELLDLGAGQDAVDGEADVAADLGGDSAVVAGDDLDRDAEVASFAMRCAGVRLGPVDERQEPRRAAGPAHLRQSARGRLEPLRVATATTRAPSAKRPSSTRAAVSGTPTQRASTASGAPFVIEPGPSFERDDDRGQLALVVERQHRPSRS